MQIEPFPESEGYRCWLSQREQEILEEYYSEEPVKRLAIELMLDGLRSEEVPRVKHEHFRTLDVDEEAYKLRIPKAKTGYRECPVSNETKQRATMLKNARGLRKDDALVMNDGDAYSERQIQRWVSNAAEDLAEENGDEWRYVTAHDLRRTWATYTYYSLHESPGARDIIMRWGGWVDEETFRENYIGREPDDLALQLMEEASLK